MRNERASADSSRRIGVLPLENSASRIYGDSDISSRGEFGMSKACRKASFDPLRTLALVAYSQPEPTKLPSIFRPVTSLDSQLS